MRLVKINRLISFALALVFCVGAMCFPVDTEVSVSADGGSAYMLRVGMYVSTTTDSRLFSALTESGSGFEIGVSGGDSFSGLFKIGNKSIIILPHTNANFENGNCVAGEGNIGAYSAVAGSYKTYSEAASRAKSLGGFVAVVGGGYEVRTNPATSADKVKGKKVASPVDGGLMVLDENGKILLTFEDTSRKFALRAQNGGFVTFPMVHRTGAVYTAEYQGFFEYSISDGRLFMINVLDLEDYTKCVMANEIGMAVSTETRKAFSVLARTLPMQKKHAKYGFDVCCNSACCQVYRGRFRMDAENNAIVDSTRGELCTYNGSPILALYCDSNGGASCSSVAAWGGNEVPYLKTVFLDEDGNSEVWEHTFTKNEFYEYMKSRQKFSGVADENISIKILEKDPYGSDFITALSVSDGSGNTFEVRNSEAIRSACGFSSANFDFEYTSEISVLTAEGDVKKQQVSGVLTADGYKEFDSFGDEYKTVCGENVAPEKIVISGEGTGHGVGFSAMGSEKLAAEGYSYKYILGFFFDGTEVTKIG